MVEGVFGLDNRPQATPHFQVLGTDPSAIARVPGPPSRRRNSRRSTTSRPASTARGQCIAIIELGGGFKPADISAYFAGLKLPVPNVKAISVDGGRNHPTNANSADGEVMLDIEVAAAIAPKATIAVYFAPNTNQGFLDAITTAVHDSVNKPSVISISWGSAESNWTAQAMTQFDKAFQAAASMGVTVCCASGDNGSADGVSDGKAHVDFPASSLFALGCGGTKLTVSGTSHQQRSRLERERQEQRDRRRRERLLRTARLTRRTPRSPCRCRRTSRPAAAFPMSPATPTRTAATGSASTASRW